jgi:TRAP-type C4-dicarboxylate transport system permease small subunit
LGEIVLMATSLLIAVLAWPVVSMLAELDQRSQAANIPLVLPQAMIPVGFLLMALLIAVRLISQGKSGEGAHLKNSDH